MDVKQVISDSPQVNTQKNEELQAKKVDSVAKRFFNAIFSRTTLQILSIGLVTVTTAFLAFNPGFLSLLGIIAVLNIEIVISCIAVSVIAEIATVLIFVLSFVVPTSRGGKGPYIGGYGVSSTRSVRVCKRTDEKQPLGTKNGGCNCWLCALFQIIVNIPEILENIKSKSEELEEKINSEDFKECVKNFLENQEVKKKFSKVDKKLEKWLSSKETAKTSEKVDVSENAKSEQVVKLKNDDDVLEIYKKMEDLKNTIVGKFKKDEKELEEKLKGAFISNDELLKYVEGKLNKRIELYKKLVEGSELYKNEMEAVDEKGKLTKTIASVDIQNLRKLISGISSGINKISPDISEQEDPMEAFDFMGILPKMKYSIENICENENQNFEKEGEISVLRTEVVKGKSMIGNINSSMNEKIAPECRVPAKDRDNAVTKEKKTRLNELPDILLVGLKRYKFKNKWVSKKISELKSGDSIRINGSTYNVNGKDVTHCVVGSSKTKYQILKVAGEVVLVDGFRKVLSDANKDALKEVEVNENESYKITDKVKDCSQLELKEGEHSKKGSAKYNLKAFIMHLGDTQKSGHYIAYIKGKEGVWYECNDSSVSEISESKAEGLAESAYFYIYQKAAKEAEKEVKE
jgi:ubiquitin C-terminal hydrolase